jgi:hypothetical protein
MPGNIIVSNTEADIATAAPNLCSANKVCHMPKPENLNFMHVRLCEIEELHSSIEWNSH